MRDVPTRDQPAHGTSGGSGGPGRDESPQEQADRRWTEMLQEVRVAQTGAQVLFGFLVSVAFTPHFEDLPHFDRTLYVVTVLLGALATGTLIAPVSIHRITTGHNLKPSLIRIASRMLSLGLTLLALTIGSSLLLLLRSATDNPALSWILAGLALAYFATTWLVLPQVLLRRPDRAGYPE
ncbi:DUF6328 family protein [Kitasatospora sp. NPDC096147]|uniref:DUF6328 family protein n=1 Tax=Kitasatospora sp. NPDC096147 TaxID=3364093 RepID=UPI003803B02C